MRRSALRRLWSDETDGGDELFRLEELQPPSRADEAGWVFLAAAFIVLCVIYVYGFQHYGGGKADPAANAQRALLPYQVLFRDLPSPQQRIFRQMQEGVPEIVRLRAAAGQWPAAEALASEGVPPFARDVLDKSGLRWTFSRDGLLVNYLGVPATTGAPAYLILGLEPDPITGEKPPPPAVVDEEHQLLPDGTLLHVTYWTRSGPPRAGIVADPSLEGWQQVRVRSPFEEMEQQP